MSKALGRDVARALRDSAAAAGAAIDAAVTVERPWASALFEGTRFTLVLADEAAEFGGWLDTLPEADLPLRGHFVASTEVTDRGTATATVEILAVSEG